MATLERQIYEAIRGKCVSDAAAERAAALAAELAVEKFQPAKSAMASALQISRLVAEWFDVDSTQSAIRPQFVKFAQWADKHLASEQNAKSAGCVN